MLKIEANKGVLTHDSRGTILGLAVSAWLVTLVLSPYPFFHAPYEGQRILLGYGVLCFAVAILLSAIYLLLSRRVVEIDKSTHTVTFRTGSKSQQVTLGTFQDCRVELKPVGPWRVYAAILVGHDKQIQILSALSEASLLRKVIPVAEWLGIRIVEQRRGQEGHDGVKS